MSTQSRMPDVGPVGRNVIANVERLRAERGMSWRKLSAELEKAGRAIPPLGLSRFVKGRRRVDPDELLAFAEVLGVAPGILLMPPETAAEAMAEVPAALRDARNLATCIEQTLTASGDPGAQAALSRSLDRALRRVQIEVEELIEEPTRRTP